MISLCLLCCAVCGLPVVPGSCTDYSQRYYFDRRDGTCKTFTFGGCRGNGNNFVTKEECEGTCIMDVPGVLQGGLEPVSQAQKGANPSAAGSRRYQNRACSLPAEAGPCLGHFPSFYYNAASGQCEPFIYGGCMGNNNRFDSDEACRLACTMGEIPAHSLGSGPTPVNGFGQNAVPVLPPPSGQSLSASSVGSYPSSNGNCNLPKATGQCLAYIASYFYNTQSGQCESFIYGGCQGNANRFSSRFECEQRCLTPGAANPQPSVPPACLQPKKLGLCRAHMPRWFFDLDSLTCRFFYYGGCGGNDNNFRSQAACEQVCRPPALANNAGVAGNGGLIPQPTQEQGSSLSQPNTNSGSSPSSYNQPEFCALPKVTGPCRARIPAYYYDEAKDQCLMFIYGGCSGNENRFSTFHDCQLTCGSPQSNADQQVALNAAAGLNDEPPMSVENSIDHSLSLQPQGASPCSQPKSVGPCKAAIPRFYYDQAMGQCQTFLYGGCSGNTNNFATLQECFRACPGET
jgi:hypothetical protein